jgi:hypothetical protein
MCNFSSTASSSTTDALAETSSHAHAHALLVTLDVLSNLTACDRDVSRRVVAERVVALADTR